MRPDRLFAVSGPQARVQRRTVQQIVDFAPLPTLDDPAPQMVVQLPDVLLRFFRALSPDPEQVIEVPMIVPEDVSLRTAVREPQLVEQLVEVPTVVSWSMLQQIMEQNVDIPVVDRGSGAGGSLSGFLPGQYSMTAEQIVDTPVPRRRFLGYFQGLHRGQSSAAFFEQIADPGGGPQDFLPVQGPAVSSLILLNTLVYMVFALFPHPKKVRRLPARWMKICPGTSAHPRRRLMRFSMLVMTSGCRS